MPSLHSKLDALAAQFAEDVMTAVRGSSLQELLGPGAGSAGGKKPGRPVRGIMAAAKAEADAPAPAKAKVTKSGRLKRRSADEITAMLGQIVTLVKKHKDGLRAEEIRSNLGLEAKEMPRVLKEGIKKKALSTKGQKRATTYFAK